MNDKEYDVGDLVEGCVDENGKPYIFGESRPAGGGLDMRCSFNKEVSDAFNKWSCIDDIIDELYDDFDWSIEVSEPQNNCFVLHKKDTIAHLECNDSGDAMYVYTEFDDGYRELSVEDILREQSLDTLQTAFFYNFETTHYIDELFDMIPEDALYEWIIQKFCAEFDVNEIKEIFNV